MAGYFIITKMTMRKGTKNSKDIALNELQRQISLSIILNGNGDCRHTEKLQRALSFYRSGEQCDNDSALAGLKAVKAGFISKKFERNGKRRGTDMPGLAYGIYDLMNTYSWRYNGTANRKAVRIMETDIRSLL